MNNFQFLRNYQELQYTIMFDKLIDLKFARVGYCRGDKSGFWNFALVNKLLTKGQLLLIEKTFKKLQRQTTVYSENRKTLKPLIHFLMDNNYKFLFEDSWLFYSRNSITRDRFNLVKKVNDNQQLTVFLRTFDTCYKINDPQNPYGQLGDYLKVTEKTWHKHHRTNRAEYFIIYDKTIPVAVSTLTSYNRIGYISNVGSLKKVRGKGFGKLATLYCVALSKTRGNLYHCLATEEGTYPHEFYQRIGFKKKFSAAGYYLPSPSK